MQPFPLPVAGLLLTIAENRSLEPGGGRFVQMPGSPRTPVHLFLRW